MLKIQRNEYCGETLDVAKNVILGAFLYTELSEGCTGGIITEVEAYLGGEDKASHAYGYKRTKRTEIQFGVGGYAYVYLVYGMHHQFNIVTNIAGKPECVLVRAIEPITGIEIMQKRRGTNDMSRLSVGPGNLCAALGISRELYGEDLTGAKIYLCKNDNPNQKNEIAASARIGIDYAEEFTSKPWRFYLAGNKFVSGKNKYAKPH